MRRLLFIAPIVLAACTTLSDVEKQASTARPRYY